jgi:hypothetical protein
MAFAAVAMLGSACSFAVSTEGLSGGSDPGGGGSAPQTPSSSGGATSAGVELPDGGPVPAASSEDAGGGGVTTGAGGADASPSPTNGTGSSDAATPAPIVDAAPAHDANPGIDSAPPTACSLGHARVFVTSTLYAPNFGGVSGADASCLARATAGGLGGKWRAWLSDSSTAASVHIESSPGGYYLLNGTVVASNLNALLSGSLAHAIDVTELDAAPPDGFTEVWTGIDVTGGMTSSGFCGDNFGDDWASASSNASTPLVGHLDATDATWSAAYLQLCNRTNVRLYCVESCK